MSLLTIIRNAAARIVNIPQPEYIKSNPDLIVVQMAALVNEEGQNLAISHPWQKLIKVIEIKVGAVPRAVWNISEWNISKWGLSAVIPEAQQDTQIIDQGDLDFLAPGYSYIIDDTLWIKDQPYKLEGAINIQDRSWFENHISTGHIFWIEGNHLFIAGVPLNEKLRFRYQSKFWVRDKNNQYKDSMTDDTDMPVFPERLLVLGLCWRWLSSRGLPYQQAYLDYQQALNQYIGKDTVNPILSTADYSQYAPNVWVGGTIRTI